jgi:hypothetical protein
VESRAGVLITIQLRLKRLALKKVPAVLDIDTSTLNKTEKVNDRLIRRSWRYTELFNLDLKMPRQGIEPETYL